MRWGAHSTPGGRLPKYFPTLRPAVVAVPNLRAGCGSLDPRMARKSFFLMPRGQSCPTRIRRRLHSSEGHTCFDSKHSVLLHGTSPRRRTMTQEQQRCQRLLDRSGLAAVPLGSQPDIQGRWRALGRRPRRASPARIPRMGRTEPPERISPIPAGSGWESLDQDGALRVTFPRRFIEVKTASPSCWSKSAGRMSSPSEMRPCDRAPGARPSLAHFLHGCDVSSAKRVP